VLCLVISLYYVMFIFFLTCYMFRYKLILISLKLKKIAKRNKIYVNEVERLLIRYSKVCREIEHYNRIWNRYVALGYLAYTVFSSLYLSSLIFDKDPSVLR